MRSIIDVSFFFLTQFRGLLTWSFFWFIWLFFWLLSVCTDWMSWMDLVENNDLLLLYFFSFEKLRWIVMWREVISYKSIYKDIWNIKIFTFRNCLFGNSSFQNVDGIIKLNTMLYSFFYFSKRNSLKFRNKIILYRLQVIIKFVEIFQR